MKGRLPTWWDDLVAATGCAHVVDHRGKIWGLEKSARTSWLWVELGATARRECSVDAVPSTRDDVTLVREGGPDEGDTLHMLTTTSRDDAEIAARIARVEESLPVLRGGPRILGQPLALQMPEGTYDVLGSFLGERRVRLEIPGGIPVPRSYHEEDRTYALSLDASSFAEALVVLKRDVERDRAVYGGSRWRPRRGPALQDHARILLTGLGGVVTRDAGDADADDPAQIVPELVERLNVFCAGTGAGLVLTSSWMFRRGSFLAVVEALTEEGLRAPIVGACPSAGIGEDPPGMARWLAIDLWLASHPQVRRWAVLDRRAMPEAVAGRCVHTDPRRGITTADAARIRFILDLPPTTSS